MTERPILFSGPMVRAILDGRKSQTRRVLKPQPTFIEASGRWGWPLPKRVHRPGCCTAVYSASREWHQYAPDGSWPYATGDRLWVRETFCGHLGPLPAHMRDYTRTVPENGGTHLWYRADDDTKPFHHSRWTPSIHMPKWAARIWLTVTEVRVQRLQWITEPDAMAEGAEPILVPPDGGSCPHVEGFEVLWNSIHGPGAFERNDWVAAISFERAGS